jgi:hypothetical protein
MKSLKYSLSILTLFPIFIFFQKRNPIYVKKVTESLFLLKSFSIRSQQQSIINRLEKILTYIFKGINILGTKKKCLGVGNIYRTQ